MNERWTLNRQEWPIVGARALHKHTHTHTHARTHARTHPPQCSTHSAHIPPDPTLSRRKQWTPNERLRWFFRTPPRCGCFRTFTVTPSGGGGGLSSLTSVSSTIELGSEVNRSWIFANICIRDRTRAVIRVHLSGHRKSGVRTVRCSASQHTARYLDWNLLGVGTLHVAGGSVQRQRVLPTQCQTAGRTLQ